MTINFYEDIEFSHYKFGDKIDDSKVSQNIKNILPFSFIYATSKEDYSFDSMSEDDSKKLIERLIEFGTHSIDDLLSDEKADNRERHLHPSKKLDFLKKVEECYGCPRNIENRPDFYHFALYTNENASRETGVKSPRIHFMVGNQAIIYLLFYDAYHELC